MTFNKENFRRIRQERGLTLDDVAAACGVSQSMVSRWEKRGKAQPRPAKIVLIAAALQCPKSEIANYGEAEGERPTLEAVAASLERTLALLRRYLEGAEA